MPRFTPEEIEQLRPKINTYQPFSSLVRAYLEGRFELSDFPELSPERQKALEDARKNQPNPAEQAEWRALAADISAVAASKDADSLRDLKKRLADYVERWKDQANSNVAAAKQQIENINARIQALVAEIEEEEYRAMDITSRDELRRFIHKYPESTHRKAIELDYWKVIDNNSTDDLREYLEIFPDGSHAEDAKRRLENIETELSDWTAARDSQDIFKVIDFICGHPRSPFIEEARALREELIELEMKKMADTTQRYDIERLRTLVNGNVISRELLVSRGIVTENVLRTILDPMRKYDLPDISQAIEMSRPDCKEGFTDIYFFGIPSTGKTCVLMGLTMCPNLDVDTAADGGPYAAALKQYTRAGMSVPSTPGDFVTTLKASIETADGKGFHNINLIEMSGEEFAVRIANANKDGFGVYSFNTMATGATALLSNNNRKVFFIIIDPKAKVLHLSREVRGFDEQTGEETVRIFDLPVDQATVVEKIIDLLCHESNSEIMDKVDAIHFIMTKADLIAETQEERMTRAKDIFFDQYSSSFRRLVRLCKEHNINTLTDHLPKLYTFSLGSFYIGGIYEYNPEDSNLLVKAIRNSTIIAKDPTLLDKICDFLN